MEVASGIEENSLSEILEEKGNSLLESTLAHWIPTQPHWRLKLARCILTRVSYNCYWIWLIFIMIVRFWQLVQPLGNARVLPSNASALDTLRVYKRGFSPQFFHFHSFSPSFLLIAFTSSCRFSPFSCRKWPKKESEPPMHQHYLLILLLKILQSILLTYLHLNLVHKNLCKSKSTP